MFSGIVETVGTVTQAKKNKDSTVFHIQPQMKFNDLHLGDSVSVNGVCLTITELMEDVFSVTAVPETLRVTNLNNLEQKSRVNLERSLLVGGRNGGHNVQGHVDCVGNIIKIDSDGKDAWLLSISVPAQICKYIVNKGYITLDGMSITVIEAGKDWFSVTLIPHTREVSIAKDYRVGSPVNIEVDILGKYIERLINERL